MSYVFDPATVATVTSHKSEERKRRAVPESEWRRFDFGMDCLIPAEDYALPKDHDDYRG